MILSIQIVNRLFQLRDSTTKRLVIDLNIKGKDSDKCKDKALYYYFTNVSAENINPFKVHKYLLWMVSNAGCQINYLHSLEVV